MSEGGSARQQQGRQHQGRQQQGRRERIAAQRAAAQRGQRRNRLLIAGGAIIAVVAIVLGFVLSSGNSPSNSSGGVTGTPPTGSALAQLVSTTTTVPAATLDKVGAGQATAKPMPITGAPLTSGGKPEMLYMGAEYCPYCAAERWAMVVALSRFGTFHGLSATHSAAKNGAGNAEPYPNTATFTFYGSTYTSNYVTFTAVEMNTNIPDPGTGFYTTLQTPTAAQQALLNKYDAAYNGAIPFIDYGNKLISVGATYDPGVLSGLTWSQIAGDLHNPDSPVGKAALGAANYTTAAICSLTGDQPASACTQVVKSLQARLG
jgi:thiol-disulfide isomerase/thioredoxin